jgi:hypothetical protein
MKKHTLCLLYLLCVLLLICMLFSIHSNEGFEESIPNFCGSAGYTPSKVFLNKAKPEELNRQYSKSECAKIDGTRYNFGQCTLKKDGKDIILNEKCKGLNKVPSSPPDECKVDGKVIGITNKEFKIDANTFAENTVRLYTQTECESLNGKHDIAFLAKMNDTNRNDFIDKHGKGYGFCSDSDNMYSFMCYAEPPSVADVKNKIAGMFS